MQILISMQNNQKFFYNIKAVQSFESLFFVYYFGRLFPPSTPAFLLVVPPHKKSSVQVGAQVWCPITFGYPYKQKTLSELDTLKGLKYYYQRNQAAKSQSPATKCYPLNSPIAINLSCLSATSFSTGILDNVLMSFRSTFFTLSKVDSGS